MELADTPLINLKRKLPSCNESHTSLSISEHSQSPDTSESHKTVTETAEDVEPPLAKNPCMVSRKTRKSVRFDGVRVYLFERSQGFTCVPSQGGSTLGMSQEHWKTTELSTREHMVERSAEKRRQLWSQHKQGRIILPQDVVRKLETDELPEHEQETLEEYYFLQPVPIRQRRAMLRSAGVQKIDGDERLECQEIRVSRELCGCECSPVCRPETCACAKEGICCQMDRVSFPCTCQQGNCGNPHGRVEFNPIRVRTHYIHTQMRLGLENQQQNEVESESSTSFNSTERGACRDCQDDKYIKLLMQEVAGNGATGNGNVILVDEHHLLKKKTRQKLRSLKTTMKKKIY